MTREASQPGVLAFTPLAGPQLDSLLASVSADLEAIFASQPGQPAGQTGARSPPGDKVITFVGGGDRRKNKLGPLALALCGGALGLFALTTQPPSEPLQPPAPSPATAAFSIPGPVKAAPAPAEAAARPQAMAIRPALQRTPDKARPVKVQRGRAAPDCSVRRSQACAYTALQQADRRLRLAYSRAIRAGVSRDVLLDYRTRWNRARRVAADSPKWALSDYKWLEKDLAQETRGHRSSYR